MWIQGALSLLDALKCAERHQINQVYSLMHLVLEFKLRDHLVKGVVGTTKQFFGNTIVNRVSDGPG